MIGAGLVAVGSASGVTTQNGPNNYAGPKTCSDASAAFGVTFDSCTTDTNGVTQNSNGGTNVFEAAQAGPGGSVVQNNTAAGTNKAFCVLVASASGTNTTTNQSCDYTQNTGTNTAVVDVQSTHTYADFVGVQQLSQDAVATVKVAQNSANNNNTVAGVGGAALIKTVQTLNSDVQVAQQQRQERLILLDVDQNATGSGNNSVDFNLDSDQSAVARGLHPDQGQDVRSNGASDPNAKAFIYQRTATGTNYTKGRGTDKKALESTSIDSIVGGAATQRQWHTAGGFNIIADVDSSGNPGGGTVDFGTPYADGTDCLLVDGFRKIGTIVTKDLSGNATTAGTRRQDDGLPIGIPGLSPNTATAASCSKLNAPAGTFQHAGLSVKGHAKQAITGAMSAALTSGATTSGYRAFEDQTVNEVLDCTRNTPNTCTSTSGGVTGSGIDIAVNEDEAFTKDVAEYTNANPSNPVTSASINWGDSTPSSAGTISGTSVYKVSGTHTYADPGTYTVTTTVTQQDASTAVFTSKATVTDIQEGENVIGGTFVIGDKAGQFGDARPGSNVTFWSQSWASLNPTTTGVAPSSFKGWQNTLTNVSAATCGATLPNPNWQSKSGNAPPPPAGALPRYLRVIVASNVGKSGSTPIGNVKQIVVIDTLNNTYNPNPAANGSGVVNNVLCTRP